MSGLLIDDNKRSLLLRSSSLFVNINGFVASTLARLCYFNQFDHEAEAVFVYNDNETFITDFHATIGQRKVHMDIRELLGEEETERFDVQDETDFVISIGKIPPNALVLLEVDVLGELQTAENGQALVFKTPEIFTPFYSEFSDACNKTQAYKFDLKIRTDMPFQLAGCYSPSHAIQVDADAYATSAETVFITLAEEFRYDQQIKVYFYPAKPSDVYARIESGIGPIHEINYSPRNTRCRTTSPRTSPNSVRNTTQWEECLLEKQNLNPSRNKEVIDGTTQQPSEDLPSNKTEHIFYIRSSGDGFLSKTNPEQVREDTSCLEELASELKHNVCPEDYINNQTFCLMKDPKDSFINSEKMDSKAFRFLKENLPGNEKDEFADSLYNTKSSSRSKVQHLSSAKVSCAWSKKMLKRFEKGDERNSEENTTNTSAAEYNQNSKTRPRHFFSDSVIATSFLPDLSNYPVYGEYIFMLDRSGSMNGLHICNAKESLVLFLKSLPTSSYFNVVSFGSYSRSLFPCSQRYSQDSLEKGCAYVNSIKADMGGSELMQPLKAMLEKPRKTGYLRNVFVLTDGDIAQPDAILRYLRTKCHKARIFTFGIGPKISQNIVCNIARHGRGKAYFSDPTSKVQTKVIQCLKDVLKPALCDVTINWRLPSNCQLLRPTPEIPFSISGQRINLYASAELPSREQSGSRKKRKSSVKEFWFDEELDSCQLGDNMFYEDFNDNGEFSGYWGTDTDVSTSDNDQEYDDVRKDRTYDVGIDWSNIAPSLAVNEKDGENLETILKEPETTEKIETDQSHVENIVKNWRKMRNTRLYSSDTSTETEDEFQADCENQYDIHYHKCLNIQNGSCMNPPETDSYQRNSDFNHNIINSVVKYNGLKTSDDIINNLTHVTDISNDDVLENLEGGISNKTDVTKSPPIINASYHLKNNVTYNDVIYNDVRYNEVIPNDVNTVHMTENGKQADRIRQDEDDVKSYEAFSSNTINSVTQKSKENVIDCDNYETGDNINESTHDEADSDWAGVLITGYIGPDMHRERIPLYLNQNTNHGVSLHQMAAKKFIDGMEAILDSTADPLRVERDIVALSKESRVHSCLTSSMTIDDMGNTIGVFQDSWASRRCKQLPSFPKTGEDTRPAILVSSPSVEKEPWSPTKQRFDMFSEADANSDDGKYYRIERLDPEGCDQGKRETRRKRLADCRTTPGKVVHRRKIVSTRLTLLTRKMRNANKLNVFAGPPYIRLILLQSAEGFWQLTYAFARIIGLPLVQLELAAPFVDSTMIPLAEQDDRLGIDCYYDSLALWATALALVYLRNKWMSHEEDWELIAIKAETWLQRQTFPQGFGYIDVMLAAKQAIVLLQQKYRTRAKSEPIGQFA